MKIDTSWKENLKMLIYIILFFAITGGIRWYSSLDNAENIKEDEMKNNQVSEENLFYEEFNKN